MLCSAGLNLLLLSVGVGLAKYHHAKPPSLPDCTVAGAEVSVVPEVTLGELGTVVTNLVPFRWAQLESEDSAYSVRPSTHDV